MECLEQIDSDTPVATRNLSSLTCTSGINIASGSGNDEIQLENSYLENCSIRSNVTVTYSASKQPTTFMQLAPDTNINPAPSNWLRRAAGLRPCSLLSGSRSKPIHIDMKRKANFFSLGMADSHLALMGDIDVVSDAENIKKLLKAPYSKAHISMVVHRIGKTLLLEQFNADEQQEWFQFVCSKLPHSVKATKKKLPSAQLDRLMLSKFLYYSLNDTNKSTSHSIQTPLSNTCSNQNDAVENVARFKDTNTNSKVRPKKPESRWKSCTPMDGLSNDVHDKFERTILWTFEDLQMLLGSNMPIFGGGEYPAVSLKLFDSKRSINILTGIDYWLDNLICNVPEVVMCFHVNGIVQNYEVIKTEEIPKLEGSKFNPQVIKDIARSVLSFLKSNCTQEGHTYWLFKGSNDDVVKLYDLSTLCDKKDKTATEGHSNDLCNPYTAPVASLLYKMANNLFQQKEIVDQRKTTIKRLLDNCIGLLEKQIDTDPCMLAGAYCMLSTLFVPKQQQTDCVCQQHLHDKMCTCNGKHKIQFGVEVSSQPVSSCHLTYCIKGLQVSHQYSGKQGCLNLKMSKKLMLFHTQQVQNIVLIYFALAKKGFLNEEYGDSLRYLKMSLLCYEYLDHINKQELKSGEQNLASHVFSSDCYYTHISHFDFNGVLANIFTLCGDIQLRILQQNSCTKQHFSNKLNEFSSEDIEITQILMENDKVGEKYKEMVTIKDNAEQVLVTIRRCYETAISHLKSKPNTGLPYCQTSIKDHYTFQSEGTDFLKEKTGSNYENKNVSDWPQLFLDISRKVGHVANEQGALQLVKAVEFLSLKCNGEKLPKDIILQQEVGVWKICFSNFEDALNCFDLVGDYTNQALVLSNLGKLMRICAQSAALENNEAFTSQERNLYEKALRYYEKALELHQRLKDGKVTELVMSYSKNFPTSSAIYDNISWELSSTYFAMAQRLQDHAPIHVMTSNEIEHEIIVIMGKSLKSCLNIWKKNEKQPHCVLRCGEIHGRLASLHHHSFQQAIDQGKKRHLKALAENQYGKACCCFEQLIDEHPTTLLRIQLEWLSLQEKHVSSIVPLRKKLKEIVEGFKLCSACLKPIGVITLLLERSLNFNQITNGSTSVDSQQAQNIGNKPKSTEDLDEWIKLSEILNKIITSLLLVYLKVLKPQLQKKRSQSVGKRSRYTELKDIYSRTLRDASKSTEKRECLLQSLKKVGFTIQELQKHV